ncbi:cell wall-binding repeat-containing protein [Alkalihalobacillus sp. CinArs1]|uniref:cell wall-binding repeat-containing protein n=1 Tax=Alkalihalobacillus sp. CinArs1 TaxID=2995314 RepID=UPI0022DD90E4|nr:cell wall-binding repeat-containing protein [Alkalihalobacillus sp. CinArs1]
MKKTIGILFSLLLVASILASPAASAATGSHVDVKTKDGKQGSNVVSQEQEPNDSFENANKIALEESYKGTFTKDDKDYYKVTITGDEPVDYSLGLNKEDYSVKEMDLNIVLYDSSEKVVEPYKSETEYTHFYGVYKLTPGVYYIEASDLANVDNGEAYILSHDIVVHEMPYVDRAKGKDRYETAAYIAYLQTLEGGGKPDNVVLTTGANYADALAGAPLAYHLEAPILLTMKNELPDATKGELDFLEAKKVTIVGGTGVVSMDVENYLKEKLGLQVDRISGKDRYETAAAVAAELPETDTAVVAYGKNFPDALSVASEAARNGMPILLTDTNNVPEATKKALENYEKSYVVGGKGVISEDVFNNELPEPTRLSGKDRYATSIAIANEFKNDKNFAVVATGEGFADALTGSLLAANFSQPLLLTPKEKLDSSVASYFKEHDTRYYTILGGEGAVSKEVEIDIWELIK